MSTVGFLKLTAGEIIPHPSYTPDMSLPDFNLFCIWKEELGGVRLIRKAATVCVPTAETPQQKWGVLNGTMSLPNC